MASAEVTVNNLGRKGDRGGSRRPWRGRGAHGRPPPDRARPTHFISVPLDDLTGFTSQISNLTDSLLTASPPITGLDPSIIISPNRLHLTLGVMNLASEARPPNASSNVPSEEGGVPSPQKSVTEALTLLHGLKPEIENILQGQPLQLCLNEIAVMRRSPVGEADVMYIGPTPTGTNSEGHTRSVKVLETVNRRFNEEGFITDTRQLKLHCTILNTSHRKGANRNKGRRIPFSMAQIEDLIAQSPHIAGTLLSSETPVAVRQMNICKMGSYDELGRYVKVGGIEW